MKTSNELIHPNLNSSRRDFLRNASLLSGGLIIALSLPACHRAVPPSKMAGSSQPSAWLRIGTDNKITIIVDRSEMGQGVYTTLPMLIAEELELPLSAINIEAAPVGAHYVNDLAGGQLTGGSTSTRDAWEKLRIAGAQARMVLIEAASRRLGAPATTLWVKDGYIHGAGDARLTFGDVAELAATLPLPSPKEVVLKKTASFELIGKGAARLDSPSKIDGSAEFGIDVKLRGMKYAALIQSPVLGGTVQSVDSTEAVGMPGVVKILTVGQGSGVLVVATHYWQALKARDALKIVWSPGARLNVSNATIRAGLKAASSGNGLSARKDGDALAVLKSAPHTLSATYELPLLAHATLEPMNCTADVQASRCDVYVGTQVQQMAQEVAAHAAGMKPDQVRIHTTLLGGGFGRRLETDFIPAAVEGSKALGAPVKVIWTREDDMTHDTYRPPAYDQIVAGLAANGDIDAIHIKITSPSVTARLFPSPDSNEVDSFAVEAAANYLYDVPNIFVEYVQHEVGIDVGYWRSVSHALNCFVVESFMDELAHSRGVDPVEYRRQLLKKQPRALRVLNEAASRADWGKTEKGHFLGVSVMEGYGSYLAQVADISLDASGKMKIHRVVCVVDCGIKVNPKIVESQVFGGIVFGLSAALWGDIHIEGGEVKQANFDTYRVLRMSETPQIDVHLLDSTETPGGMGEPSTALVAPAVANALFAATRKRLRTLPFAGQIAIA